MIENVQIKGMVKLLSNQIYVYCTTSHIEKSIKVLEKSRFLKSEPVSVKDFYRTRK